MGMLDAKKMIDFYSNARFLVMTSSCYEGFPTVFLEAMAHKLPVIAPKLGGNPEIIKDYINGLLFEPGNTDSLATAIKKLWNDKALSKTLSKEGFHNAQQEYGAHEYYKKLEKIYDQLFKK